MQARALVLNLWQLLHPCDRLITLLQRYLCVHAFKLASLLPYRSQVDCFVPHDPPLRCRQAHSGRCSCPHSLGSRQSHSRKGAGRSGVHAVVSSCHAPAPAILHTFPLPMRGHGWLRRSLRTEQGAVLRISGKAMGSEQGDTTGAGCGRKDARKQALAEESGRQAARPYVVPAAHLLLAAALRAGGATLNP